MSLSADYHVPCVYYVLLAFYFRYCDVLFVFSLVNSSNLLAAMYGGCIKINLPNQYLYQHALRFASSTYYNVEVYSIQPNRIVVLSFRHGIPQNIPWIFIISLRLRLRKYNKMPIFIEVPLPSQESEPSYICVWGYSFCLFLRSSIENLDSSDSVVFFVLH